MLDLSYLKTPTNLYLNSSSINYSLDVIIEYILIVNISAKLRQENPTKSPRFPPNAVMTVLKSKSKYSS